MASKAEFNSKVFSVSAAGDEVRIVINNIGEHASRVFIRPCDYAPLASYPHAFKALVEGKNVILTGRGPVEAYFALAYYCRLSGVRSLACEGPDGSRKAIAVDDCPGWCGPWYQSSRSPNGQTRILLRRSDAADGKWDDSAINFGHLAAMPSGDVVISGPGSVAMYALLGVSAAVAKVDTAWIDKPGCSYLIGFSPYVAGQIGAKSEQQKQGIVVGIVGDPNSGKSVFSKVLSYCVRQVMPAWYESWIYDCDFASPTPDWYLTNVTPESAERYKAMKNAIKAQWTDALEERVAEDLNTLRGKLDFVIADMPGGRHPKNGENFEPKRIPSISRVDMMQACDGFIILSKSDYALEGWKKALAKWGMHRRIVAVVTSSDPEGPFSCESSGFDDGGVFHASIRGLDRKKNLADSGIVAALSDALAPIVRHLSFRPVVAAAGAGLAKAFLTKDGGTRYGAAVRSATTGKIYSAGQYASWNHTTNIHAEMSALAQAAAAGDPDVDVLAVACSKAESASPCGVCRQVMSEHARRTGRDFDVVFVSSATHYHTLPVSGLMADGWVAHPHKECVHELRQMPMKETLFTESVPQFGSIFLDDGPPRRLSLVWDPEFLHGAMLVKPKYEEVQGGFRKLPHAFSEAAHYRKFLVDSHVGSTEFPGGVFRPSHGMRFANPKRIEDEAVDAVSRLLFNEAGIDSAKAVKVMCSRALSMNRPDSDYDLVVGATWEQIREFREVASRLLAEGAIALPQNSKSWNLLCAQYPGAEKDNGRILFEERRYAETFQIGRFRFSVMFIPAERVYQVFPGGAAEPRGFTTLSGRVGVTWDAAYKRSSCMFRSFDGRDFRLVSYNKTANLLKDGDAVAISGLHVKHCQIEELDWCGDTILQLSPATDKIVWMH